MDPNQALIVVSRRRESVGGSAGFKVILDGQPVGRVQSGSRIEGEVTPGRHELQVRAWRKETETIEFDAAAGERIDFLSQNAHSWKFLSLWDTQKIELVRLDPGVSPELKNTWSRRAAFLQVLAPAFVGVGIATALLEESVSASYFYFALAAAVLLVGAVLRTGRFDKSPA